MKVERTFGTCAATMSLRVMSYLSPVAVRCCVGLLVLLIIRGLAHAQTFTTLANFSGSYGSSPLFAPLIQGLDGNLYGTASAGGAHSQGTVFKVTPAGTLTTLYSFCASSKCTDGSAPYAGLMLATDGNFYGTTESGGAGGAGTVVKNTQQGKINKPHNVKNPDGDTPL